MSSANRGVDSIDHYERRRKCWLKGCRSPKEGGPFCEEHMSELPDDILYRIEWAYNDGNTMDWLAAIQTAITYLIEPEK